MKNKRKAILLVGALLCLNLNIFSQNIPLKMNKVSVKKAMTELKEKSGYSFVYIAGDLDTKKIVDIDAEQLQEVIEQILEGQNVSYEIKDKNIIIRKKEVEQSMLNEKKLQDISGLVMDVMGEPIVGVNVMEKGTTNGTITDMDGKFLLKAPANATLIISFIGYKTLAVNLEGEKNVNITLKEDLEQLDEVVVVGYGTQKKSSLTASVATVPAKELSKQMGHSVAAALQGRAPGVEILQKGGEAGADIKILVRGAGTFGATEPLYVIDGAFSNNGLNSLNPSDIESIQVLKDAASTAIYGARANNGVILVTTKKGVEGRTQITYKFKGGVNFAREGYKYLDAGDYLYYQRLGWQRTNGGTSMENQKGFGVNSGVDLAFMTDANKHLLNEGWRSMADPVDPDKTLIFRNHAGELHDLTFRNAAFTQDHYLNLSGGNDKGTFSSSLGYYSEDGQIISTNYQRVNGTINGSYKLLPVLTVNAGGSFSWSKMPDLWTYDLKSPWNGETGEYELFYRTMSMFPTWNPWNEDGSPAAGWSNQDGNPYYWKDKLTRSTTNRKTSFNIGFALEILPQQLFLNGNSSMYYTDSQFELFEKKYQQIGQAPNTNRNASQTNTKVFQQQHALTLEYKKGFSGHNINAMAGGEYFDYQYQNLEARVSGAPTDDIPTLNAGTNRTYTTSVKTGYRILSGFARVNYDYNYRYMVSLVARYDGISKLSDNRWGFFPGISAGWNVHEEAFFKDSKFAEVVSLIKPRISYGLNGNVNGIGNFDVYGKYGSVGAYNGNLGYLNTGVVNSKLRWEKSHTFELGLDLGFFNNRIHMIMDYYDRTTSDLLTDVNLPEYTGFPSFKTNLGTISNRGFELEAKVNLLTRKDWSWDVTANTSFVKNMVKKLPFNGNVNNRQGGEQVWDPKSNSLVWVGGIQEGKSLGDIIAYKQVRILRDWDDVRNHAGDFVDEVANLYGPNKAAEYAGKPGWKPIEPGDVLWDDKNGDNVINSYDRQVVGNIYPKWTGGFSTTLNYKNWSLYGRFDYAVGHTIYNDLKARILGQYNGSFNLITDVRNSWSENNTETSIPKFYWADQNAKKNITRSNNGTTNLNNNNSTFYEKGDYLCLREVTLSYKFPKNLINKVFLTDASVYVTGQNLFYITGYDGTSPEPVMDIQANGRGGIDNGRYPTPRTVLFGLQLSF